MHVFTSPLGLLQFAPSNQRWPGLRPSCKSTHVQLHPPLCLPSCCQSVLLKPWLRFRLSREDETLQDVSWTVREQRTRASARGLFVLDACRPRNPTNSGSGTPLDVNQFTAATDISLLPQHPLPLQHDAQLWSGLPTEDEMDFDMESVQSPPKDK